MKKLLAVCVLLFAFSIAVVTVLFDLNKSDRPQHKKRPRIITLNNDSRNSKPKTYREYLQNRDEWKKNDPEYAKKMDAEIEQRIRFKNGVAEQ